MLCLLGPIEIELNGHRSPLRLRPKSLALLVRLALADVPLRRGDLAGLLFGEADDPRASLRWHLNHLRGGLPESVGQGLLVDGDTLHLQASVDARVFTLGARAVAADPGRDDALDILSLYRGDLCERLVVTASPAYDGWLYAEQERLRREFRLSVRAFGDWALEQGRASDAVEPLSRLVTVEPYFEDGHVLLIRSLEQAGHAGATRTAYRRYARILKEELRATPDPELAARYGAPAGAGEISRRLPSERFVALPDVTLHVVDWPGDEPTILAVPGSGMSAYAFTVLAERIAPDFRFVGVDLRGSGFSDKPPGGYSIQAHAQDVAALATSLGLARPVLLGFSIGGAVATLAANRAGARGLILLEGAVGTQAFTRNAAALVVGPIGGAYDLTFGGFDEYLRQWRAERSPYSPEAEGLLEAMVRLELAPLAGGRVRKRGLRTALEQTWLSAAEIDTLAELAKVACPVLVVRGRKPWIDGRPYLDDDTIEQQLRAARRSQLVIAEASNHPRLVRDPEPAVVDGIKSFVRGLRRK
jgi:pimeloyl-ACP methyl ester carboxylesterase/DNA-binding SARP family transcriptional activator